MKKQCAAKVEHKDKGFRGITFHCTGDRGHKGKHRSIMVKYGKVEGRGKYKMYPIHMTTFWW